VHNDPLLCCFLSIPARFFDATRPPPYRSAAALWAALCKQEKHHTINTTSSSYSTWTSGGGAAAGTPPFDTAAAPAAHGGSSVTGAAADALSAYEPTAYHPSPLLDAGCAAVDAIHAVTGLPWWAAIPLTTLTVKTVLLPLSIRQAKIVRSNMAIWKESYELSKQRDAKESAAVRQRQELAASLAAAAAAVSTPSGQPQGELQQQQQHQQHAAASLKEAAATAGGLAVAQEGLLQLQRWQRRVGLYRELRIKCDVPHPAWFLANIMVQWPVFVYLGLCVRSMAQRVPAWSGFESGGCLWFTDLTLPAVATGAAAAAAAAGGAGGAAALGGYGAVVGGAGGGWALPMGAAGLGLPLLVTGLMITSIRIGVKASGGSWWPCVGCVQCFEDGGMGQVRAL